MVMARQNRIGMSMGIVMPPRMNQIPSNTSSMGPWAEAGKCVNPGALGMGRSLPLFEARAEAEARLMVLPAWLVLAAKLVLAA
jgi:hypothetical protein